jgi:hypothetical protein
MGLTGIRGRGVLWHYGPNVAHDTVITRWKLDSNG